MAPSYLKILYRVLENGPITFPFFVENPENCPFVKFPSQSLGQVSDSGSWEPLVSKWKKFFVYRDVTIKIRFGFWRFYIALN